MFSTNKFIGKNSVRSILIAQVLLFWGLLFAGITGSSLGFARQVVDIIRMDEKKIVGQYRQIRSDEWGVGTLLAIGQYNAQPRFPALNQRLGIVGKKLAITHDTSVPVAQLSAIAKPATWGFFFFDLRRSLSWYWFFPIFLGINSVWFLLNTLWPGQTTVNFLLSLGLAFAPICVAWSFWPLYIIGFAATTMVLCFYIFKTESPAKCLSLSIAMGWSLSALALTLYLPRIIPVATFMIFIVSAFLIHRHSWDEFRRKFLYLLVSLIVFAGILFSWYIDNADAIGAMLNSDYPGQRRILGGAFGLWDFVRGWFGPITLYSNYSYSNPCELSSYFSFLPILGGLLLYAAARGHRSWIAASVGVFILFALFYQYIGFPPLLGYLSGWDRSHPPRVDSAIALAQTFLFAWLYAVRDQIKLHDWLGGSVAIIYAGVVSGILFFHSPDIFKKFLLSHFGILTLVFFSVALLTWMLLCRRNLFILFFVFFTLSLTLFWHPFCIAPSYVDGTIPSAITTENKDLPFGGRILFATNNSWYATAAFATGQSVLNGVHHYADPSIYQKFYASYPTLELNRYNHMSIHITDDSQKVFDVTIPRGDVIHIELNGELYDFKNFDADFLAAYKTFTNLRRNISLQYLGSKGRLSYYQILH